MRAFVRSLAICIALLGVVIGRPLFANAQDATPQSGPVTCAGAQASADELLAFWYGPDGSQASPVAEPALPSEITIPIGPPADEATAAAVEMTVRQVFVCFEAGDVLRAFALFTDDLARSFGPEPGTPREEAEAFLVAPSADEGASEEIIAISDVMLLSDGRVGAFVVERSDDRTSTAYAIFEQAGEQWLVDEVIEFSSSGDGE